LKKLITEGLEKSGIEYTEKQVNLLLLYYNEISLWNRKLGLVNAEGEKLVIHHLLDSLSGVNLLKKYDFNTAADAGSGAGLPGIPLSIFFPDKNFTLIERSGNRCGFLRNCKELFRLDNIEIAESGLENVSDHYDVIIFRAFRDFTEYSDILIDKLTDNGILFAYKGKEKEIRKELKISGINSFKIEKVEVPFLNEERHIVIVGKQNIS
jgi:16S rRNA (guanine527-N7)-methyltransferase